MMYALLSHASWLLLQCALLYKYRPTIDAQGHINSDKLLLGMAYTMIVVCVTCILMLPVMVTAAIFNDMVYVDIIPGYITIQVPWVFAAWSWFYFRPLQEEARTIRKLINIR